MFKKVLLPIVLISLLLCTGCASSKTTDSTFPESSFSESAGSSELISPSVSSTTLPSGDFSESSASTQEKVEPEEENPSRELLFEDFKSAVSFIQARQVDYLLFPYFDEEDGVAFLEMIDFYKDAGFIYKPVASKYFSDDDRAFLNARDTDNYDIDVVYDSKIDDGKWVRVSISQANEEYLSESFSIEEYVKTTQPSLFNEGYTCSYITINEGKEAFVICKNGQPYKAYLLVEDGYYYCVTDWKENIIEKTFFEIVDSIELEKVFLSEEQPSQ